MVVLPSKSNEDEHHEENYGEHLEKSIASYLFSEYRRLISVFRSKVLREKLPATRSITHLKWEKSPQTKALPIQNQTQVEFFCYMSTFPRYVKLKIRFFVLCQGDLGSVGTESSHLLEMISLICLSIFDLDGIEDFCRKKYTLYTGVALTSGRRETTSG